MTAVTKYASNKWDNSLPAAPKVPFEVPGFTTSHRWDATRLAAGQVATSIPDSVGVAHLNSTGVALASTGPLTYAQLTSGASLFSGSTLVAADSRTFLAICRPMVGDAAASPGAVLRVSGSTTYSVAQLDADAAGFALSSAAAASTPLPATRGQWHVYAIVIRNDGSGHTAAVDGTTQAFTGGASTVTQLAIGTVGSTRRQLQVAYVQAFAEMMTNAQLLSAIADLRAHYPELFAA